jgi:hypothetical protein
MLDVLIENMAEGLVMEVLKENNIELSESTFRFHLKAFGKEERTYLKICV